MKPDLFSTILPFTGALRLALDAARPVTRIERVDLVDAIGRVAAETVTAGADVPAFARAAMDGYAVRAADTATATDAAPAPLRLAGHVFAGEVYDGHVEAGTCIEISTGAPLPDGADAVIMVERTSRDADIVLAHQPVTTRQNVSPRGSDLVSGASAVAEGDTIGPARAGALAAIGATSIKVYARPAVAIMSTGLEVVAAGTALRPGQVYDVNTVTVHGVVAQHGGAPERLPSVTDSVDALSDALVAASSRDIIVCSGGSSVGRRDLLVEALARCGRVVFHGMAVKPGKPTLFGFVGNTPLFGMPGNPTSCLSNAYILLVPFLRRTARLGPWTPATVTVPLTRRIGPVAGRHQFYSVKIVNGQAEPAFKSSGDITSLAAADGFIEIAADVPSVDAGQNVTVTLF